MVRNTVPPPNTRFPKMITLEEIKEVEQLKEIIWNAGGREIDFTGLILNPPDFLSQLIRRYNELTLNRGVSLSRILDVC